MSVVIYFILFEISYTFHHFIRKPSTIRFFWKGCKFGGWKGWKVRGWKGGKSGSGKVGRSEDGKVGGKWKVSWKVGGIRKVGWKVERSEGGRVGR